MERLRVWAPRLVAAIVFGGYALLVPPGPTWLDAGELGAAGFELGSPHPTGFPLHALMAKVASLLPVGELAFRIHLLSALCAAITVLLVARVVQGAARPGSSAAGAALGGAAGALLTAVSLTFARQATVTEVYAPTAALLAATLLLFDRVARGEGPRTGLLLAVLAGLGLGLHSSYRLLVPLPLAALLLVRLRRGARWPLLVPLVVVVVAGALHLYLPARSASGGTAATDWGHPRRAGALIDHITARDIRDSFADQMMVGEPAVVDDRARRVLGGAVDELGVLGLLAALLGAASLARERRSRWLLLAVGAVAVGDVAYAIWLNPMGIADRQNGVPLALAVGVLAGCGVTWLARFAGRAGPPSAVAAGLMMLVGPALVAWPELAATARDDRPRRWAEAALDGAPPGTVVLSRSDSLSANLTFLQVAEGARPDVAALVRQRLGDVERTEAMLGAALEPGQAPLAAVLATGRPIRWELADDPLPGGWRFTAGAVVGRLDPAGGPTGDAHQIGRAAADVERLLAGGDPLARRIAAQSWTGLGRLAYGRGDLPLALDLFDRALAIRPTHAEAMVNRGVALSRLGRLEEAAAITERALVEEPNRVRARLNAARYRLALGQLDRALAHADRARRVAPGEPDGWALAGLADARAGRSDRARARLHRALELDPRHEEARAALKTLDRIAPPSPSL